MTPLTVQRLTLIVSVTAVLMWVLSRLMQNQGVTPSLVPWTAVAVSIVAGGLALWWAWSVRQYLRGNKPSLNPLKAARIVVFAQAAAYGGAILMGAYGGYALSLLDQWGHAPRREVAISALIAAASGLVLLVAGWVAERWCRIDQSDRDNDPPADAEPV